MYPYNQAEFEQTMSNMAKLNALLSSWREATILVEETQFVVIQKPAILELMSNIKRIKKDEFEEALINSIPYTKDNNNASSD